MVDVYLQAKRDGAAAKRFFRRLIRNNGGLPRKIVTDKLRSYGVAHRELIPDTIHSTEQYKNNRAENRMKRPESGSEGCVVRHPDGSNRQARPRDFWVLMLQFPTYSISVGIWFAWNIIRILG